MERRKFCKSIALGLGALAGLQFCQHIKSEDNMTNQTKSTNEPARVVLEGVPRVDWGVGTPIGSVTPFSVSLWSCMKFLGEDYPNEYISSTSGAAFRLLWKPGWSPDNVDLRLMRKGGNEPLRRAFEAVGYGYDIVGREEGRDNEAYFRERIIESIRDKGRPVLAFGIIGPPECCIIAGYDDYGDILIGWNYYAFPNTPGVEFEPSGYFRKRDWFTDVTDALIIIGEKQEKPPLSEIYRKALEWTLEIVRTPMIQDGGGRNRHNGLAAYTAWAEKLLQDEDFPADDMALLRGRMNCHDDNMNVVGEGRWCASQFLKQIAKDEPDMAEELMAAAACYEAEYDLMQKGWALVGGMGREEPKVRKLAEPDVRRQIASLVLQARDKDEEAADHIERALAK